MQVHRDNFPTLPDYGAEIDDRPLPGEWQPPAPARTLDRAPAVVHGPPRERVHFKDAPTLPGMPAMLPEEPGEQALTGVALRAMGTDYQNTEQVRAVGAAVRLVTFVCIVAMAATFGWGALYVFRGVAVEWLLVAWLGALVAGVVYYLATEAAGRKYSSAGIELEKIRTAREIHRDRLESREAMHAAATEAWERVLVKYLERF